MYYGILELPVRLLQHRPHEFQTWYVSLNNKLILLVRCNVVKHVL